MVQVFLAVSPLATINRRYPSDVYGLGAPQLYSSPIDLEKPSPHCVQNNVPVKMKFLCIHGTGSNSRIMRVQIAPMRHELEDGHEFDFVEGVGTAPMSQDVAALASPDQSFYAFYDPSDYHGLRLAVDQLTSFVENEGPFDGVIGFSGGAVVAAMCILDKQRRTDRAGLPFRYAIFVSSAESKEAMVALGLDPQVDIIRIPTAHIHMGQA
ncbi:serine hydrolase-domain-containing protein [Xylaria arbuscula]|nr:serine hydrolase-domain-containing protein [Xylaria arbuscula]